MGSTHQDMQLTGSSCTTQLQTQLDSTLAAQAAAAESPQPGSSSIHLSMQRQRRGLQQAGAAAVRHALLAACMLGLVAGAAGSPGDQSRAFRRCTNQCRQTGCASLSTTAAATAALPAAVGRQNCSSLCPAGSGNDSAHDEMHAAPLALRLLHWDCAADCAYLCMWQTEAGCAAGTPVQKYFGKWPFVRLLGMQEPASVLCSLLNLAAHAHCLLRFSRLCRRLRRQQQAAAQEQHPTLGGSSRGEDAASKAGAGAEAALTASPHHYPYTWLWAGYMLLSINAWLWSAVFHSRDTRLTERFDYFSAALLIFFNLLLSLVRVLRLRSVFAQTATAAPLLLFLASHFRHMLFVLFDYGYHVKVCIAAGAAQSLLWLGWAAASAPPPPGRRSLLSFLLLVNACMALEVLDFPPLWHALDAHSLWHAATAPLVYLFYRFIAADVTAGWQAAALPKAKQL